MPNHIILGLDRLHFLVLTEGLFRQPDSFSCPKIANDILLLSHFHPFIRQGLSNQTCSFIRHKSNHCFALSVSMSLGPRSSLVWFIKVIMWIFPSCYMDFSTLIHGFLSISHPLPHKTKPKVWPRFQSLLKLLLWNKGQSTQCLGYIVPLAMSVNIL